MGAGEASRSSKRKAQLEQKRERKFPPVDDQDERQQDEQHGNEKEAVVDTGQPLQAEKQGKESGIFPGSILEKFV